MWGDKSFFNPLLLPGCVVWTRLATSLCCGACNDSPVCFLKGNGSVEMEKFQFPFALTPLGHTGSFKEQSCSVWASWTGSACLTLAEHWGTVWVRAVLEIPGPGLPYFAIQYKYPTTTESVASLGSCFSGQKWATGRTTKLGMKPGSLKRQRWALAVVLGKNYEGQ